MKKDDLYTKDGWISSTLLLDCPEPFVFAIGGRGIGKTYSILNTLHERNTPFIYMRRTQTQLDSIAVQTLNPYNQICIDKGCDIICEKISKQTVGFFNRTMNDKNEPEKEQEPFAIGIALSTFSTIRSLSAERFEVLFFDEIIPERHERPIKEEGIALANVIESINRNRELQNHKPIKCIFASNSNFLNSDIIKTFGVLDVIDRMNRKNDFYYSNGDVAVFRFIDSPISERKKESVLYRTVNNKSFTDMSLNNKFSDADYENVKTRPIKEYNPLCSFDSITVMKHKSKREYYVINGITSKDVYHNLPLSRKSFCRKYYYLYSAMIDKVVYYQTATAKLILEGAFNK